jgi:hypothetical protein
MGHIIYEFSSYQLTEFFPCTWVWNQTFDHLHKGSKILTTWTNWPVMLTCKLIGSILNISQFMMLFSYRIFYYIWINNKNINNNIFMLNILHLCVLCYGLLKDLIFNSLKINLKIKLRVNSIYPPAKYGVLFYPLRKIPLRFLHCKVNIFGSPLGCIF